MINDIYGVPVVYVPDYCDYDVDKLWDELPFDRRESTPRTECWMNDYGDPYTYGVGRGERTYIPDAWNVVVDGIRNCLNEDYNASFDCCFCNGYLDANDQLGWHADDSPEMDMDHPIVSISFGAERDIWFRKTGVKGMATKGVTMGDGSMTMMNAAMQATWEHRIPKHSAPCGKRVSLTYRKLVK